MGQTTRLFRCDTCQDGIVNLTMKNGPKSIQMKVDKCDKCSKGFKPTSLITLTEIKQPLS